MAAALAAGETPSPEDLAREKVKGFLTPPVALALLLVALAGLVLTAWLADRAALFRQLPADLSSRELTVKAQKHLGQAGYADFTDSAFGPTTDLPLLDHLARTGAIAKALGGSGRWPASCYLFLVPSESGIPGPTFDAKRYEWPGYAGVRGAQRAASAKAGHELCVPGSQRPPPGIPRRATVL